MMESDTAFLDEAKNRLVKKKKKKDKIEKKLKKDKVEKKVKKDKIEKKVKKDKKKRKLENDATQERKKKKRIRKESGVTDKTKLVNGQSFDLESQDCEKDSENGVDFGDKKSILLKKCKNKKSKKIDSGDGENSLKRVKEKNEVDVEPSTNQMSLPKLNVAAKPSDYDLKMVGGRIVSFTAKEYLKPPPGVQEKDKSDEPATPVVEGDYGERNTSGVTLLLFYQYIEPVLDKKGLQSLLSYISRTGGEYSITGRMRTSTEGLNCTLTGEYTNIRKWCKDLREYGGDIKYFDQTEFKLTDNLPKGQAFPKLHAFEVDEIVNYGLSGMKAPSIMKAGVHLEPKDYHVKMTESDTVIIDVRNHYEAAIGKFQPPATGAKYIDPMMRKSTEFPVWLDKPETKEMLRGKQVMMYCTGGVRCERASALLRTKIEKEEDTKALNIKGVYQLQGGIDKYFREFPEGGWWRGKNYVFDKRFAHAPPAIESVEREKRRRQKLTENEKGTEKSLISPEPVERVLGKCEACQKAWDKYRGKRRCPTCGVPSLICKECSDKKGKALKSVRCDLCVKEGITSKSQIKEREEKEMEEYELKLRKTYGFEVKSRVRDTGTSNGLSTSTSAVTKKKIVPNPRNITRLFIKNMCVKKMNKERLCSYFRGITHIKWMTDRETKKWYGAVFVEMASPNDAARAIASVNKTHVDGRVINVSYAKPDPKNIWPPPECEI